jgi:hypothetical protein
MPLVVKSPRAGLLAFRMGSVAALRETDDLVTQLQAQIKRLQCEKATVARELAEARFEISLLDLLARTDSPSSSVH